ncbi:protein phosphatase 2C 37 [Ziziphus jujuba]|uniref:protein-serine/threonine phosphatase n=1 Tax=Ziziphus jujuba TaxID=326968 RepID=A0ABM3ICN2_ZIZJJ|nr:protein phosphatase 2C 37 [Ziziphus jujuba]
MAGICCELVESETSAPMEPTSRTLKRRKMELMPFKFMADVSVSSPVECSRKRHKLDLCSPSSSSASSLLLQSKRDSRVESCESKSQEENEGAKCNKEAWRLNNHDGEKSTNDAVQVYSPKFGMTSVCGRRRDMEDAVSIHPGFIQHEGSSASNQNLHFYGVFDGHGCSHVAFKCKDRLHEIVKEEVEVEKVDEPVVQWKETMEKSFERMDKEIQEWCDGIKTSNCRCELQTPQCDAVGSTAVVAIVTPEKIIVSNCGDSRAVLCRNGVAIPLSSDHKPDRPDELVRIEAAGGRVIYWDGPRVLGMLAMSRAIGDNYLKPYVISEPEVMITDRTDDDECLILASDGLWDVVSNDTACGVVRMCLRAQRQPSPPGSPGSEAVVRSAASCENSDKACSDASILLTKLALARHSTDNVSVVVVDLRRNYNQV